MNLPTLFISYHECILIMVILHEISELLGIGPRPNTFTYAELRTATEDFNPTNKLGEGGFGPVYKVN